MHRPLPENTIIKSATIRQTSTAKYYISILVEYEMEIVAVKPAEEMVIGIDYSSSALYVDSEGHEPDYPRFYRETEGKQLVIVDKWYPSSKLCHLCQWKNTELTLGDRKWKSPNCGATLDRDINAALNIKKEGNRLLNIA